MRYTGRILQKTPGFGDDSCPPLMGQSPIDTEVFRKRVIALSESLRYGVSELFESPLAIPKDNRRFNACLSETQHEHAARQDRYNHRLGRIP